LVFGAGLLFFTILNRKKLPGRILLTASAVMNTPDSLPYYLPISTTPAGPTVTNREVPLRSHWNIPVPAATVAVAFSDKKPAAENL